MMLMNDEQMTRCFRYLDQLRASGRTNMYGARPFLVEQFNLDLATAGKVLQAWFAIELRAPMDVRIKEAQRHFNAA